MIELPAKLYFRIGEVAKLLEVKPHVIRYWEKEFRVLKPKKSAAGQRIFARRDVERLATIRHLLYVERYTLEGARKHLREKGFEVVDGGPSPEELRAERLRASLEQTREKLVALLEQLPTR
ncbi:MAG: MerR family transcriptional regulator [Deltaproteobacteria bacterium]|nr:MerR family transcriptional regulator [Deltaproteobacteria bacterium]